MVRDEWQYVIDMTNAKVMNGAENNKKLVEVLEELKSGRNMLGPKMSFKYGNKDVMLYALGGKFFFGDQPLHHWLICIIFLCLLI